MTCTSKRSSPSPATVRLMPSIAIDPLCTMYGASGARKADRQPVKVGLRAQILDEADGIDVSLHEVTAEPAVGAKRAVRG